MTHQAEPAAGFRLGGATRRSRLRSMWWKGSARPRICRTVSCSYVMVPSLFTMTVMRYDVVVKLVLRKGADTMPEVSEPSTASTENWRASRSRRDGLCHGGSGAPP